MVAASACPGSTPRRNGRTARRARKQRSTKARKQRSSDRMRAATRGGRASGPRRLNDASNGRVVHASKLDATLKIVPERVDARADKARVEAPGQASISGA